MFFRQKLIWAVSQALRTEGISSKHPDFRACATALALHYDQVRREWIGPPPTSTSEHMLNVVSARVAEVVRAHRSKQAAASEPPFRDATSSLNVGARAARPPREPPREPPLSLDRRIPSARKSLTFENFDDSSSKSNKSSDALKDAVKDAKCDDLRTNARRVSRSLFGAENDGSKALPKDSLPPKGLLGGESSSKTLNGSTGGRESSGECLESRENLTPSGRKRLKLQPETSPAERRVTRRAWASASASGSTSASASSHKKESSTVESTDSSQHPPSHSDSAEPVSGSASEGFPAADAPLVLNGASSLEGASSTEVASSTDDGSASASLMPDSHKMAAIETKVITPILEATAMESSPSCKSKEGSIVNGDLSFSGRIQRLKPAEEEKENAISIDLGLATSTSACLLDLKEEEGKGQDLTRWAEMATRSITKEHKCVEVCSQQQETSAEESLHPWMGQSQLTEADSQCPAKLYEKYKTIFDTSSQEGNS